MARIVAYHQPRMVAPLCPTSAQPLPRLTLRSRSRLSRRLPTPDILQEPVLLRESVQRIVALGSRPHESAECVHLVLARVTAVLINLADGDLYAGVVLGFDDAVCGAAFAGDIAVTVEMSLDAFILWILWYPLGSRNRCLGQLTDRRFLPSRSPWLLRIDLTWSLD